MPNTFSTGVPTRKRSGLFSRIVCKNSKDPGIVCLSSGARTKSPLPASNNSCTVGFAGRFSAPVLTNLITGALATLAAAELAPSLGPPLYEGTAATSTVNAAPSRFNKSNNLGLD